MSDLEFSTNSALWKDAHVNHGDGDVKVFSKERRHLAPGLQDGPQGAVCAALSPHIAAIGGNAELEDTEFLGAAFGSNGLMVLLDTTKHVARRQEIATELHVMH